MKNEQTLLKKVNGMANVLSSAGIGNTDYLTQLTYILFLKMDSEKEELGLESKIPDGYKWKDFCDLSGEDLIEKYEEILKKLCDKAIENGAHVIISNNATEKVMKLFKNDPFYKICYVIEKLSTLRTINCKGTERKTGQEVIFWGSYDNVPFPQANDMKTIISLLKLDKETLDDKKRIMEIIKVGSERQVMYYLSALQYFKFLDSEYHFTTRALETEGNEKKIKEAIYTTLNELLLFKKLHHLFLDKREADSESVFNVLIEENVHQLSDNTLRRRASTIKSWVDWMYKYEDENEL